MTTIATIVGGLKTVIETVSAIDQASTDEYLPPINTADTALIIPAFGQESEVGIINLGAGTYQTHRFRCELWVKHNGDNANLTQRARAVGSDVVRALLDDPTLGGVVDSVGFYDGNNFDYTIRAETADGLVELGGVPYLVVTVIVPVTDFSPPT